MSIPFPGKGIPSRSCSIEGEGQELARGVRWERTAIIIGIALARIQSPYEVGRALRQDDAGSALKQKDFSMREYDIAAIPADGIGPEVIAAGTRALSQRVSSLRSRR
ncbi:MAG: hypothetical protein AB7V13_21680 [Pseudorhodoplanes sp.]